MSFVHGYLLAGLVALGVPVLIHLLNRQKPQPLPFPAFRFLKLKRSSNRRRMTLRNLLLLLARLFVLALIVLALARPQLSGARTPLTGAQPVLAVLAFDTSPSMEYTSAGVSRLDEARTRARELLAKLSPESKVRIVETGEPVPRDAAGWLQGPSLIEGRLAGLRSRPVVETLPRLIDGGLSLLSNAASEARRPCVLVVFSDRTVPSWPTGPASDLPRKLELLRTEQNLEVQVLYVDVGVDKPRDLAIESIETRPDVVVPGAKLEVRVAVRAVGGDFNTVLNCQLDNDPAQHPPQAVNLSDGQRQTYTFERVVPPRQAGFPDAPVQVTARLDTPDPLLANNAAFASVPARSRRKLLLIADVAADARNTRFAIQAIAEDRPADAFEVVQLPQDRVVDQPLEKLQEYVVVVLHQTEPKPALWELLGNYVEGGGGLIIVPGGDEMLRQIDTFNLEGERVQLLPGKLDRIVKLPAGQPGVRWADFKPGHALTDPFLNWKRANDADFFNDATRPQAYAYWAVDAPVGENRVVAAYSDREQRPALLERRRGRGRVLLYTVPLDGRTLPDGRAWHNYWKDSSFGLVLLDLACQDLAGRVSVPSLRFQRGQEVRLSPPAPAPATPYKLTGPGLSDSETRVTWNAPAAGGPLPDVVLPQATSAGNYQLRDNQDRPFTGFSIAEPAEESNLARVPAEGVTGVLGDKSLLPVGQGVELTDVLAETFAPPTELLPLVLLALLVLLVLESWLANRYYKPVPVNEEQAQAALRPTGELTRSRI